MPDSLLFDAVDDKVVFSPGTIVGTTAWTAAAIIKRTSDTAAYADIIGWNADDKTPLGLMNVTPATLTYYNESGIVLSSTATVTAADSWLLIAYSRPDGSAAPGRFHRYKYSTTTWIHENGDSNPVGELPTCTSIKIAASGIPGNFFNGNILIVGWWESELSDGTIETLNTGLRAWIDAAPAELWRLNNLGAIASLTGTSTESSRTGTTIDAGAAPNGWADDPVRVDYGQFPKPQLRRITR